MNETFTEKQHELMWLWQNDKLKRINLLEGSVSSGKTWISLVLWAFWVHTMPCNPDDLYLMSGRSLTTLKRNCLLLLQSLVGEKNFTFSTASKEGYLFGRHILLEGANDIQSESKIRGLTLQGAYCDEVTKLNHDFFTMLLSRLRKPGAKLIGTTNPDAPGHWTKVEYIDRQDDIDMLCIKFLLDDNTMLPADYIENIKKEYTGVFYDRFILGNWVLAEGLIYPMYQEAIEEAPEGKPENQIISIDYGTMNAFACGLWAKYGDVWYMTYEYYYSGRDTNRLKTDSEYADDMCEFLDRHGIEICRAIVDPSAASFIAELRRRKRFRVTPADNDVLDGIRETAVAMKKGLIKISGKCKAWKQEAEGYVWDENSIEDRPIKINDHLMDSCRYFVKTMRIVKPKAKSEGYNPFMQ